MTERVIAKVDYSARFLKHLSRLPKQIVKQAEKKEIIFKTNAFDPRLRTHKLHGKDKESWAFWIDYHYRIKFIFLNSITAIFIDIGTHNEVY